MAKITEGQLRTSENQNGFKALAIAGTYVVMLGWDIVDEALKNGLLGFAIRRTDHAAGETYWLRGMKAFPTTQPPLGPGQDAATNEQPIQSFQWADYTAKPETQYSYELVPMYGAPGALAPGASVTLNIATESEWDGTCQRRSKSRPRGGAKPGHVCCAYGSPWRA